MNRVTGTLFGLMMLGAAGGAAGARPIASAVDLAARWGIVTSVKRSPAHNQAVGGAPNSFHLSGRAIDIARRPGVRHADIEQAFRKAGYALLESLDEGDHSHFAFGLPGAAPALALHKPTEMAAKAAEAEPCAAAPAATVVRRRPDRTDGCELLEPAAKYRPLRIATD